MGFLIFALLAAPCLVLLWKYLTKNHDFFLIRGIPFEKPLPFIGSLAPIIFQFESNMDWMLGLASKYRGKNVFGIFDMHSTTFVFQEPEIIKEVCIKKFDNSPNHASFGNLDGDQLLNDALFAMRDQRWKDMRATLSPAFTTSKMRMMWSLVKEVGEEAVKYVNENMKDDRFEINSKDFYSKLTIDVISTCAFGLKVDSIRDPDNQVHYHASRAFDFNSVSQQIKFLLAYSVPKLANRLGLTLLPPDTSDFFNKLVKDTLEHRKRTGTVRPDVLQLLLQAMEGKLVDEKEEDQDTELEFAAVKEGNGVGHKHTDWTYSEIAAQCFVFFIAGNETTSLLLSFGSYELAMNQDVQEKLYNEIKATKNSLNGKPITYDILQKLPYLDSVISETLRKHPAGFILDRVCDKDVQIDTKDGDSFIIPKGSEIWINVIGMHYDHRYFPAPERFVPERFMPENRDKIIPGTFIPFGVGPRACIGSRFALMEAKVLLYHIISEFSIEPCEKTITPLRYAKGFQLNSKEPLILEYRKR